MVIKNGLEIITTNHIWYDEGKQGLIIAWLYDTYRYIHMDKDTAHMVMSVAAQAGFLDITTYTVQEATYPRDVLAPGEVRQPVEWGDGDD